MSRRKLRTPNKEGHRVFCGPFSLMAITGWTATQTFKRIRDANWTMKDRKVIKGMYTIELQRTLEAAGIKYKRQSYSKHSMFHPNPPTLAAWLRDRKADEKRAMFIIAVTGHFIVVCGNDFIDTFTEKPVKVDDCPHRRARVVETIKIL